MVITDELEAQLVVEFTDFDEHKKNRQGFFIEGNKTFKRFIWGGWEMMMISQTRLFSWR